MALKKVIDKVKTIPAVAKFRKFISGFTVLELVIASAIIAVLALSTLAILSVSQGTINTSYIKIAIEEKSRTTMEQIVKELRTARRTSVLVPVGNESLSFRPVQDFGQDNANPVVEGNEVTYRVEDDPDDNNGDTIDNDGDGLTDERQLVRIVEDDTGAEVDRIIISRQVQNCQFVEDATQKTITITFTLFAPDPSGRVDNGTRVVHTTSLQTEVLTRTID